MLFKQNNRDGDMLIKNWKQFGRHVRSKGCHLLHSLNEFPDAVLVAGCQRSGTTMLSRVITKNAGMVDFWVGRDDELDAALILSGVKKNQPSGRYCFQTTYLNECFSEYFQYQGQFKLIWLIRNPRSVVYSMAYNWKRFALNELFDSCGIDQLDDIFRSRYSKFGRISISPFMRACFSYSGKTSQIFEILNRLDRSDVMVLDYDDLVKNKTESLKRIFNFIEHPYDPSYGNAIHAKSLGKASRLSRKQLEMIRAYCEPVYQKTRILAQ